jgi:type I restriction enzyme S subunit
MNGINLPDGWYTTTLENIATWGSGGTPSRKELAYYTGNIPWIKTGDLGPRELYNSSEFISELAVQNSSAKYFPKGSVAIAMYGATIGKTSILGIDATTNQACGVGNPIEGVTFSEFLYYFLLNEKDNFIAKGKGGAQPNISQALIKQHECALPPVAEQKVIADKLETLLAQVETTKARLDRIPQILKIFRQSVLSAAVSGKLTEEWREENSLLEPISLDDINSYWTAKYLESGKKRQSLKLIESVSLTEVPTSWINTNIGYVFDVYVGATPSRKNEDYWNGDVSWVSSSEVAFCRINSTKETVTKLGLAKTSTNIHPPGTVMLAMIGQGKTRGQVALLDIEACHNQNTAALRVPTNFVVSEYLYFYLTKQYEETRRVGGGNNQQALNKSFVQSLEFPLPPFNEQTEIVRRVEQLFAHADKIEQQVQAAQQRVDKLTQSILAKAFRGELTTQWRKDNPDLITGDNSAEALLTKIKAEREAKLPKKKAKTKKAKA